MRGYPTDKLRNVIKDIVRWHMYAFGNFWRMLFKIFGLERSAGGGMLVILLEEHFLEIGVEKCREHMEGKM